jgi:glycyl-tRNA synthetase
MSEVKLEAIVSLCKRRGFIYQGSEIYGGLAGTWDYGPLGVALKRNIQNLWWKMFVEDREDMYGVDAAILMNQKVWQASGHVDTFTDPMVECSNCRMRFRKDHVVKNKCPNCGKENTFGPARQFNMMFQTIVGPAWATAENKDAIRVTGELEFVGKKGEVLGKFNVKDTATANSINAYEQNAKSYLRPETAQGMFTNFKNVVDSFSPDMPFGLAQMGKAFRNEISPRDFVFRSREFEQMEIEYFIRPEAWEEEFEKWRAHIHEWLNVLGLPDDKVHELEVPEKDRAHYSKRTIDFEFDFPVGRKELLGLAYRTDFDLQNHTRESGKSMEYRPKDGDDPFVPHVIEPSFGVERTIMAVLTSAYSEDEQGGEKRTFLKLPIDLAPVRIAVFPLLKNKPELVSKAREVYDTLKKEFGNVVFDDNGNIGKRYRRQDEIGTPHCVTIDFDTLENDTVTLRDRDTTKQERIKIEGLKEKLSV